MGRVVPSNIGNFCNDLLTSILAEQDPPIPPIQLQSDGNFFVTEPVQLHDPSLEAISHQLLSAELPNFLSSKMNTCTALESSYKGCIMHLSEKYQATTDSTLVYLIFDGFGQLVSALRAQHG